MTIKKNKTREAYRYSRNVDCELADHICPDVSQWGFSSFLFFLLVCTCDEPVSSNHPAEVFIYLHWWLARVRRVYVGPPTDGHSAELQRCVRPSGGDPFSAGAEATVVTSLAQQKSFISQHDWTNTKIPALESDFRLSANLNYYNVTNKTKATSQLKFYKATMLVLTSANPS